MAKLPETGISSGRELTTEKNLHGEDAVRIWEERRRSWGSKLMEDAVGI
jgi:hypothetical protein